MMSLGISKRKSPHRSTNGNGSHHCHTTKPPPHGLRRRRSSQSDVSVWVRWLIAGSVTVFVLIYMTVVHVTMQSLQRHPQQSHKEDAEEEYHSHPPRVVHFLDHENHMSAFQKLSASLGFTQTTNHHSNNLVTRRRVAPMINQTRAQFIKDSKEHKGPDVFETDHCKAMFPWQLQTFPACNPVHEIDMTHASTLQTPPKTSSPIFLTSGFWRDVWVLRNTSLDGPVIFKTMRFMHNVTHRNFDRNRRDALVSDRLTGSPWILDVYGFCGNTGLSEYAEGGDIGNAIWRKEAKDKSQKNVRYASNMTHQEQMQIGVQAALGLAALHNFDEEGRPSVAHTDISPGQWVKVRNHTDGSLRFKLQDFNRARFLRWDHASQKVCTYRIPSNPGKNRSPEEYAHKPQTEQVDLYSLGNLFYMLLQKEWPFRSEKTKKAQSKVKRGYRPSFYEDVWNSKDPYDKALKQAMLMCHEQEPSNRSSAREVADYLKQELERLDPGTLASWGEPPIGT